MKLYGRFRPKEKFTITRPFRICTRLEFRERVAMPLTFPAKSTIERLKLYRSFDLYVIIREYDLEEQNAIRWHDLTDEGATGYRLKVI